MDRKDRSWPGGPTPPAPYPYERMGAKNPAHEVDQHVLDSKKEILVTVDGQRGVYTATVHVWMTCPDARLMSSLTVMFVPESMGVGLQTFSSSTIHLVATADLGFGPLDVEDLLGTNDAPTALVQPGLWGMQYSPTEEVEAMRADLVLGQASGSAKGKWWVQARWQALRPMSHLEWVAAVALCKLEVSPLGKVIDNVVPG